MKTLIISLATCFTFILVTSCVQSTNPFYLEENLVEMDEITGTWLEMNEVDSVFSDPKKSELYFQAKEDDSFLDSVYVPTGWVLDVEKNQDGGYIATHHNGTESNEFLIHSFKLYGQPYLDIVPVRRKSEDHLYSDLFVATHVLARVNFRGEYASVQVFISRDVDAIWEDLQELENSDSNTVDKITYPNTDLRIEETEQLQEYIRPLLAQDTTWHSFRMIRRKR